LIAAALIAGVVRPASAGVLIASDDYQVGSSPALGQYATDPNNANTSVSELKAQSSSLHNTGFANGAYSGGTATSQFYATSTGLTYAPLGESSTTSGAVAYSAAPIDNTYRANARNLTSTAVPVSGVYWESMIVSQNGLNTSVTTANSYVLGGFGNAVQLLPGAQASNLQGIAFGFAQENGSGADSLIMRARVGSQTDGDFTLVDGTKTNTANTTFAIIAQINVNVNGGSTDVVNYWVNPTDLTSINGLNSTAAYSGTANTFAVQGNTSNGVEQDFTRLTYASYNWNGGATFDDAQISTSLDTLGTFVAPTPEPASALMLGLGLIPAFLRLRRSARLSRTI
jgi:hypothetical protein